MQWEYGYYIYTYEYKHPHFVAKHYWCGQQIQTSSHLELLNQLGRQGWELVSLAQGPPHFVITDFRLRNFSDPDPRTDIGPTYYFKRRL